MVHQDPALLDTKSASEASRPALFTPESKSVAELLQEMQQASTQIAVVVDEYGGVAGIVTVEDLIEELVGEIGDEYDREVVGIEKLDEVSYRVHPRTTLDEIEELCEIELEDDDVDTIGGLLVKTLGVLPKGGEQVEVKGLRQELSKQDLHAPGGVGADHHQFAMGHVDDAHQAVGDGQTERNQQQDGAQTGASEERAGDLTPA